MRRYLDGGTRFGDAQTGRLVSMGRGHGSRVRHSADILFIILEVLRA